MKWSLHLLKSMLNARNLITAVNTWAVPVLRYSDGLVEWTKEELQTLNGKNRILFFENGSLNRNSYLIKFYPPQKGAR